MGGQAGVALYVLAMAAVIVGVDFLFFKHRFWERLIVKCRHCFGVRSFLLEIPQESMIAMGVMATWRSRNEVTYER